MNEQKLEKVIEKGCEIKDVSEAVFRERIVSKLLEALGYDLDKDVEYEVERSIGTNNSIKMDYVINLGKDSFVLEVKPPGKSLDEYYNQIISYIRVSLINYGILYNGKQLLIFSKDSDVPIYVWSCGSSNEIFKALKKEDFPTLLEKLLSKEANRIKLKTYLEKNLENIESLIIKKISEDIGLPIDYVSENLHIMIDLNPLSSGKATNQLKEDFTGKSIKSFSLKGVNYPVKSWRDLLLKIVNLMLVEHGYEFNKVLSLKGRKRPYFSKKPNDLRQPLKINNTDIYVEMDLYPNLIVKLVRKILSIFGYNENDLIIETK